MKPVFNFSGRTAIVTGAGRGIGRVIALSLAEAGANVVLCSRTKAEIDAVAGEISGKGGKVLAVATDLTIHEQLENLVDATIKEFGRIDILVNNAGASPAMGSVLDSDERLWDTIMNLNLKAVYFMSQACAKIMKKQGGGRIINVASIDGVNPEPFVSVYSISKAGVRQITRAFAMELAHDNIMVNAILPGPISTKMMNSHWQHLPPEEAAKQKEELCKHLPTCRIGEPDEIAGAAIYLASDASSYTTGAEIIIDGGLLLGPHL